MDRSDRVAQLYGYTVCLIAVVVFIISVMSISDSLFKAVDPLHSNGYSQTNLSSFEAYKATAELQASYPTDRNGNSTVQKLAKPSDGELRARYEALRSDRLASAHLEAEHSLTNALIMLIVAIGLFVFHWRWLRTRAVHAA